METVVDNVSPRDSQPLRIGAAFGDLAVAKGFVTPEQVRECLDDQAKLSREGVQKRLGDLMIEKGYLLPHQLEAVIREQREAPTRQQLLGYQLLEKLGEGGMGTVVKARREKDGQLVAMKVLFRRLANDNQFIQRFQREAKIGMTLDHPNLVKCLDVGEENGTHFMALEFVDGEDLGDMLNRRSHFPESQALAIVQAAARGMAFAHQKGLIHRDVKPGNLMLTREGLVKVMDFGLARVQVDDDHNLTMTGVVMGTPHYIAPEQVETKTELDARADMYSLGCTLFHMLTGRPPFIGGNLYDVLNCHLTRPFPDPRKYNSGVSAETAQLILRMCQRDRAARLPSMEQLAVEIGKTMGLPSAQQVVLPATQAFVAYNKLPSTQVKLTDVAERMRCPRCQAEFRGLVALVTEGQRVRCHNCGLVYQSPISAPAPPPILPDQIDVEDTEDEGPVKAVAKAAVAEAEKIRAIAAGERLPSDRYHLVLEEVDRPAAAHPADSAREQARREHSQWTPQRIAKLAGWWLAALAILYGAWWLAQMIIGGGLGL